jgi:hypothetical protein
MDPTRKAPNIWAVAGITYGVVIAVTVLAIIVYYYVAPKQTNSQSRDDARLVTVGSVWMPMYPGANIASTASGKTDNATESTLNFETKDPADRVLSFYQGELKKGVFRFNTVTPDAHGGTVRSVVHQGKTVVVVTIHAAGQSTQGEIRTIDKDTGDKKIRD